MASNATLAMARSHQAEQVRQAAAVQAALSKLWDDTIDPNDIAGSFLTFREKAATLVGGGRILAERKAEAHFATLLASKGLDPLDPAKVKKATYPAHVIKSSLTAASSRSLGRAAYLASQGITPTEALAAAKSNMLGSAKRQVINASRTHLIAMSHAHKRIRGWARVSDGNPCGFCAMLVGRGPVYSDDTVHFKAHDRCGCGVRMVLWDDPDDGWSDDAKAYKWAYDNGYLDIRTRGGHDNLVSARWINGYTADDILKFYADDQAAALAAAAREAAEKAATAKADRIAALKAEAAQIKPTPADVKRYGDKLRNGMTVDELRALIDSGDLSAGQIAAAERAIANAEKAAAKAAQIREKWHGKPAPKAPTKPTPPAPVGPSAYDAWLQKVKDRYTAFAKATGNPKTTLEQPNNWHLVQRVIQHNDAAALQALLDGKYIDDALWLEGMTAARVASQVPAKLAAQYAKEQADYERKRKAHQRDLAQWREVNGVTSGPPGMDGALVHVTNQDGIDWANTALPRPAPGKHRDAARHYSGGNYRPWNDDLRRNKGEPSAEWAERTANLDAAMTPLPEDVILRRGSDWDAFEDALGLREKNIPPLDPRTLIGSVQRDYGYMSSSVGENAAFSSMPAQLNIRVPEGYPSVWLMPDSHYPNERELLLSRGTRLFIHDIRLERGTWIVDAEVIPLDDDGTGWIR